MTLNVLQIDAVTELANIGISRATQQLASLLNEEVMMEMPKIEWGSSQEIQNKLQLPEHGVTCVYQNISGKVQGSAALLLYPEDSQALLQGLINPIHSDTASSEQLQEFAEFQKYQYEAIMEIGNIIISSCISAMADTLCLELSLSLPHYCQAKIDHLLGQDEYGQQQNAILISAKMKSAQNHKGGYLQLLLSDGVANQVLSAIPDISE